MPPHSCQSTPPLAWCPSPEQHTQPCQVHCILTHLHCQGIGKSQRIRTRFFWESARSCGAMGVGLGWFQSSILSSKHCRRGLQAGSLKLPGGCQAHSRRRGWSRPAGCAAAQSPARSPARTCAWGWCHLAKTCAPSRPSLMVTLPFVLHLLWMASEPTSPSSKQYVLCMCPRLKGRTATRS